MPYYELVSNEADTTQTNIMTTTRLGSFADFAASKEGQTAIRHARESIPGDDASDGAKASFNASISRVCELACKMLGCSHTDHLRKMVKKAVTGE